MNEDAKRILLRSIPHGLYIVTTGASEAAHGFTATWLTQASFKPPLVMMGVRRDSHAYALIAANRSFVVNFIPKTFRAMAERFVQPPKAQNSSFAEFKFRAAAVTGAPVLEDALGFLGCKVDNIFDKGDHSVVVGEVVEAEKLRDGEALLLTDTPWKYGG